MATLSHETRFECQKLMVFCEFSASAATLSHEMRFEAFRTQKLRVFCEFSASAATLSHFASLVGSGKGSACTSACV